jgi:UDP-3-O-acyl-N-acetylglucosamine deacetylase
VLAAVVGCGIDDLDIDLTAAEPPIMDGSAQPFVAALVSAGIVEHAGAVKYLAPRRSFSLTDGDSVYEVAPSPDLELNVTIDFRHPAIGIQQGCYRVTRESFMRELAPARTFGFVSEVEVLRAKQLIQGASLDNTIVLVMSDNGASAEDGALPPAGRPVAGRACRLNQSGSGSG